MGRKKTTTKKRKKDEPKAMHKNFRDYTPDEIAQIKRDNCVAHKCPYLSKIHWNSKHSSMNGRASVQTMCNYILFAGHSRGCMPDVCEYWKDTNVKRTGRVDNKDLFEK